MRSEIATKLIQGAKTTATIERRASSTTDPYGDAVYGDFALHLTVPCVYYTPRPNQQVITPERQLVRGERHLLIPMGYDITEQDRVHGVTTTLDGPAVTLNAEPLTIETIVQDTPYFRLLVCEEAS